MSRTVEAPARARSPSAALGGDILAEVRRRCAGVLEDAAGDAGRIERHIAMQTLAAELAAGFVNVPPEKIEEAIVRALERIARFVGEQRAWLSVVDATGDWSTALEWYAEGLTPLGQRTEVRRPPPWLAARLSAGSPVWLHDVEEPDPDADAERRLYLQLGVRSLVVLPVRTREGELLGAAGFASRDRQGDWPEGFVPLCDLVGDILCGALMRQREDLQLRRSEARLSCLRDAGMLGILTARRDGVIIDANDAALAVTGYDRAALDAGEMRWVRMTPPEYLHLTAAAVDQLERLGHCAPWEQDFYRRDGSRVPVLLGVVGVHGQPGTFLVFALDVSARKRAEQQLTERKRLTGVTTVLSTRFIATPVERIDQTVDEALRQICEVVGLDRASVWQFTEADPDTAAPTHRWDRRRGSGVPTPRRDAPPLSRWKAAFDRREFILIRDGGRDLPDDSPERRFLEERGVCCALGVPLLREGRLAGFVTFVAEHDDGGWSESRVAMLRVVGEIIGAALERRQAGERAREFRRELERRFLAETGELETANRELEAFSHAVSHDLRAPLRAIDGFSGIVAEDHAAGLPPEARSLLERIGETCRRMDELIDALLTLSRIARTRPGRARVDLTAIATSICQGLRESEPARRVAFEIEPAMAAEGEPRLVRALLDNLLRNAWKFTSTRDQAHIEIGSRQAERGRVYYVRDDGVGFDAARAERLFQPFQRLHHGTPFEGHGIGLATVQRIVRVHGGRVWADSRPGQGATFYFTLEDRD